MSVLSADSEVFSLPSKVGKDGSFSHSITLIQTEISHQLLESRGFSSGSVGARFGTQ